MNEPEHKLEVGQKWEGEFGSRTILYIGPGNARCAFMKWEESNSTGKSLMGSQRNAFHQWIRRGKAELVETVTPESEPDAHSLDFRTQVNIRLAEIENRLTRMEAKVESP